MSTRGQEIAEKMLLKSGYSGCGDPDAVIIEHPNGREVLHLRQPQGHGGSAQLLRGYIADAIDMALAEQKATCKADPPEPKVSLYKRPSLI